MTLQEEKHHTELTDTSPVKVGIMGPFGYGNLGDAAIQEAVIQNIRKHFPNAEILGFSLNPEDTEKRHGIPSFLMCKTDLKRWWIGEKESPILLSLYNTICRVKKIQYSVARKAARFAVLPLELFLEMLAVVRASKHLRRMDFFIVSGGGQIDDYWGGPWYNPYALLLWSVLTKFRKTKFYAVSLGAGPVNSRLSRLFFKCALTLSDYRSYRDQDSKEYVRKVIGFDRQDPVYPDLAHSLDITQYKSLCPRTREHLVIGIGPMCYFDPRVWPEKNSSVYLGYLSKLASFVSWLLEQQHSVLFFTGEAIHDRLAIEDLRNILSNRGVEYSSSQIIEKPISTTEELLSQLSETHIVVTSRFHGVLLSYLLGKPVLALSYHKKINVLMEDMGQSEYCLDIENFDLNVIKEKIISLTSNYNEVRKKIEDRTKQYKYELDEQYKYLFRGGY